VNKWSRILAGVMVVIVVVGALAAAQVRGTGREGRRASSEAPQADPRAGRGAQVQVAGYDVDVPGFDIKRYTEFFQDMKVEYPRQITMEDETDLIRIGSRLGQYFTAKKQARDSAFNQWCDYVVGLIEYISKWDNAFVAEYDGENVTSFAGPGGERFLSGLENQPFIFNFRVKDSRKMYVLKTQQADLYGWGGIRLVVDPGYPTLFKLFISGIEEGLHDHSLTLETPDGETLYKGRFELKGVKPGRIKVRVIAEDTGEPTEVLMGLFPSNGRDLPERRVPYHLESGPTYIRMALGGGWPAKDTRACIVDGEFEMPVYPGPCRVVAVKGPEYRTLDETFDVPSGGYVSKTFGMKRFMDLRRWGWYSGDDHCHIGRDPTKDEDIVKLLSAVDLYATNIVQMGDQDGLYFLQSTWGDMSRYRYAGRVMMAGQEDPRTMWRGHTLMYDIQNTIHDRNTYYLYEDAFKEARRQGGITGYAHDAVRFEAERGATVSIPLGLVDFIELEGSDPLHTDAVYHFWNMGFRLPVFSGADFPYGQLPGGRRFYAYVEGDLTVEKYLEALRAGNTFASHGGGIVDMRVNGQLPNSIIEVKAGEPVKVTVRAALNPDIDAPARTEIVKHGKVIETVKPETRGDATLEYETTLTFEKSCWIAGRMYGESSSTHPDKGVRHGSAAHTSAFYVIVDGKPFWDEENLEAELARADAKLNELTQQVANPQDPALMKAQGERLLEYIDEAREVYNEMAEGKAPPIR